MSGSPFERDEGSVKARKAVEGDYGTLDNVHTFSASSDLNLDRVSTEELTKLETRLKAEMKANHEALQSHLELIARKLHVRFGNGTVVVNDS